MVSKLPLTIILLTKGRTKFTQRWIDYMSEISFSSKILICDGADDGEVKKIVDVAKKNTNLDIDFYQHNTNSGNEAYFKMFQHSLENVETKYAMTCDNDDFIISGSLKAMVACLEDNPEYISVGSQILNFQLDNFSNSHHGKVLYFLKPYNYFRIHEPLEDLELQIQSTFLKFQPNFYNIFRTDALATLTRELATLNFSDLVVMEFYIQLRAASLGKSKVLIDHSHYLRQRGTSSQSQDHNFSNELLKKNLPNDVRKMANKIADETDSSKDIYNIILINYSRYLSYFLGQTVLKYRFKKLFAIKQFFIKLTDFSPRFLNPIYSYISQIRFLSNINSKPSLREELKIIKNLLRN